MPVKNYVDKIWAFFDHLPPCVDIFYGMNVDKKWTFLDQLPTLYCKRSLWTTPSSKPALNRKYFEFIGDTTSCFNIFFQLNTMKLLYLDKISDKIPFHQINGRYSVSRNSNFYGEFKY